MQINLSMKKLIFIISALTVVSVSVAVNFGFFVFLVLGTIGCYYVKPFFDEFMKSRAENDNFEKLSKIVNKLSGKQREELKRLLMGD